MFLCRGPLFGLEVSRDEARAFIETQISPGPLKEHGQTIAKANQKNDVNEQPGQPRQKSLEVQMNKSQVGDCFVPANRGHAAFVEIPKALRF